MQTVKIVINDDSETLNPSELAEFLYLFPAANLALSHLVPKQEHDSLRLPTKEEERVFRLGLKGFSPDDLDSFFNAQASHETLQINQIRRNSPLEITLCGCAFLITLGIIFSGGKTTISRQSLKADLPLFGVGLKSLREALGLNDNMGNPKLFTSGAVGRQELPAAIAELETPSRVGCDLFGGDFVTRSCS